MRYCIILFIVCRYSIIGTAQVDAWIEQLKTTEKQEKVDLLNKIGEAFTQESEPVSAKTYLKKAITLAKSLRYKDGLAVAYYFMGESFSLQNDTKNAEKNYCKWHKIRKKQGDKTKWAWTLNGMAQFYASQLNDKKTEKFYTQLLALRQQQKNAHGELKVLRSLAFYYHYGFRVNSNRTLNVKKAVYYYEALIQKLREIYGKDGASLSEVDFYFKTLIDEAIQKKKDDRVDELTTAWFAFVKKLAGDFETTIRVRQVARAFLEARNYKKTAQYVEQAVNLVNASGTSAQKLRALRHGCYMMRETKHYLKNLKYAIDIWKEEKSEGKVNEWYTFSTLNAAVAKIYYSSDNALKKAGIKQLQQWKKMLHEDADRKPLKWVNENIELLKK